MDKEQRHFKESLKQDEFKSLIQHVIDFFRDPGKLNVSLNWGIGVLLVALVAWGYTAYKSNVDTQVIKAIGTAKIKMANKDIDTAIQNLKTTARDYPSSSMLGGVNFYLGQCLEMKGDVDGALKAYGDAVSSRLPESIMPAVYISYAYALEEIQNFVKAASVYEELLKKMPNYFGAGEAMLNQARNLRLAGKLPEAAAKYKAVADKYPDSAWAYSAKQFIQ